MRIIIACSRTGGHIFPALSLAKKLKQKRRDLEIIFFVPKDRIVESIWKSEFKLRFSSINNLRSILSIKLIREILGSFLFLKNFKPNLVIGFGGLSSFFLLLQAKILGIPTLIHEQNVIPGRANRILSYFVDKICISFPQTRDYFKINHKKVLLTGNPLREEIGTKSKIESLKFFDLEQERFTILVMGGSQGSSHINSVFLDTLLLLETGDIQIIHLTGFKDYEYVRDFYKKINLRVCVYAFLDKMDYAYGAADLVISRAGATTISEIIHCGLVSILIPYPYAYSHQEDNALAIAKRGGAILIEDKYLSPYRLKEIIVSLKDNREKLKEMSSKSKLGGEFDATEKLAEEIFSFYS